MPNLTTSKVLDVYLSSCYIGKLSTQQGMLSFTYDALYLRSKKAVKLSASLPLQCESFNHQTTAAFFSGLLPDDGVRQRLARYLGISEKNTFGLLEEIGGECAGAVSVYPEGFSPNLSQVETYRILDESEADDILSSLDKRPLLAGEEDIRISGAGAQDKIMIAFVEDKIAIPTKNTASTHIIKPAIRDLTHSVQNEFFCMKLAKKVGSHVPEVDILWLKSKAYYLIERYDRKSEGNNKITRLHQEDFCQSLHIAPELKYENEGGPSIEQCFSLLDDRIKIGVMAGKNRLLLLQGIIFNFMVGNGDAHGKNFSLLYEGEEEALAPFYDLLSTVVYANAFKAKMAMRINGKYKFKDIAIRDFESLGVTLGLRADFVKRQVIMLSNIILKSALELISELNSKPKTTSLIYEQILSVIVAHHKQIAGQITNDEI